MRLSKSKKIILSLLAIGVLITSIVTPILVINNNSDKTNKQLGEKIKEDIIPTIPILKNSNIICGQGGTIFQDSFKNLWTMTYKSKLQVLKVNSQKKGYVEGWTNDITSGLTKNSNITDGLGGIIFQDSFKNLWSMGNDSKLQVLKINSQKDGYVESWTSDITSGLTKNSNINDGELGIIFQDSFNNLWTTGSKTKLQVLKVEEDKSGYVNEGWIENNDRNIGDPLLKNSNIIDGAGGIIFQDSFKNLWLMGNGSKLQVLKANSQKNGYVSEGWTDDTNLGLTKNSNIINAVFGKIFQDDFGNLWTIGKNSKLQVLKVKKDKSNYVNKGWTSDITLGLTKNSNIIDGWDGIIFQDSFNNLWTMGNSSKLQILKIKGDKSDYVNEGWINNKNGDPLLKNSNITYSWGGTIFQDSFENLWTIGKNSKLQVLRKDSNKEGYVNEGWINNNDKNSGDPLLKNSNIINGWFGTIFQDDFGNLWAMGFFSKLQVLKAKEDKSGYENEGWIK